MRQKHGQIIKCTRCKFDKDRSEYYQRRDGRSVNQPCLECSRKKKTDKQEEVVIAKRYETGEFYNPKTQHYI